jgi:hypothetical protein
MLTTSSRCRQPTIELRSGPVSISTTRPGWDVASTCASPCPTSQLTIAHPVGGQPDPVSRAGMNTSTAPTTTTPATTRSHRDRSAAQPATSTAASNTAPSNPLGHRTVANGIDDV